MLNNTDHGRWLVWVIRESGCQRQPSAWFQKQHAQRTFVTDGNAKYVAFVFAVTTVSGSQPNYLRLHRESTEAVEKQQASFSDALPELCRQFQATTGWSLQYIPAASAHGQPDPLWSAPVNPGDGNAPGYLTIGKAAQKHISRDAARQLATGVAELLGELYQVRRALWQREAELAAGVPILAQPSEPAHLAERLEAVLKGGAEAVACQAAGLYLLDPATTELKLRCCWGLPSSRLVEPARPLRGAVADLEALTGHAVVLEDDTLNDYWNVPEPCAAAVCVPVSTPTTILGTLWIFSEAARDFTDLETNQIEIIAGRLAADLEREMLISEGSQTEQLRRQVSEAERRQHDAGARVVPMLDGWDLAGKNFQVETLGGNFYDWTIHEDNSLWFSVGHALDGGIAAALVCSSLQAALRSHAEYHEHPGFVLGHVNQTMWSGSVGDQFATALCGKIDPSSGQLEIATAGQVGALLLGRDQWKSLSTAAVPLAIQPEADYPARQSVIAPDEVLLIHTQTPHHPTAPEAPLPSDTALAEALLPQLAAPAETLLRMAGDVLESQSPALADHGYSLLIIRRTSG